MESCQQSDFSFQFIWYSFYCAWHLNLLYSTMMNSKRWIFLLLAAWPASLFAQSHPIEQHFFENLAAVHFMDDGTPVAIKDAQGFMVGVMDSETYELTDEFARQGRGPGEVNKLFGYGFDHEQEQVCLVSFEMRLICHSINGSMVLDKRIPWLAHEASSSPFEFLMNEGELLFPVSSRISVQQPQDRIKVAAASDADNLEEVRYLSLSFDELGLDYLESLAPAKNIIMIPKLMQLTESYLVVALPGIPYLYIFKDEIYQKRVALENDYEVIFTSASRPEFPSVGVMRPANLNTMQKVTDGYFVISHGNQHQDIPLGVDFFSYSETEGKLQVNRIDEIELKDMPEEVSEPNVTIHDEQMFIITNYHFFSSQVYVRDL